MTPADSPAHFPGFLATDIYYPGVYTEHSGHDTHAAHRVRGCGRLLRLRRGRPPPVAGQAAGRGAGQPGGVRHRPQLPDEEVRHQGGRTHLGGEAEVSRRGVPEAGLPLVRDPVPQDAGRGESPLLPAGGILLDRRVLLGRRTHPIDVPANRRGGPRPHQAGGRGADDGGLRPHPHPGQAVRRHRQAVRGGGRRDGRARTGVAGEVAGDGDRRHRPAAGRPAGTLRHPDVPGPAGRGRADGHGSDRGRLGGV